MRDTTRRRVLTSMLAAHWGYLKTGVDGSATLRANDAGFENYSLRVRRLMDISRIDTSVSLFGTSWQHAPGGNTQPCRDQRVAPRRTTRGMSRE